MFRSIDFSSLEGVLTTIAGIALVTLIGVGIRLVMMLTLQQRRERMNRQINERLRALIAAYKTLGGSFTGDLTVDPAHLRDTRAKEKKEEVTIDVSPENEPGSERRRRVRDAVEGALSDIILLGTEEQVRLAGRAAQELVAGRPVHTHDLVLSLRAFIREALDLDPLPDSLVIPMQGPARPQSQGGSGRGQRGGDEQRARGGGGQGGGGMGAGMGAGAMGMGAGLGLGRLGGRHSEDDSDDPLSPDHKP